MLDTFRNLQRYRASVLKAACEGRLVPTEAKLARAEAREFEPADVLLKRILVERRARSEADQWEKEIAKAKKKGAQAKRKAAGLPSRIRDLAPEEWQELAQEEYARYLPKGDAWKRKYTEPQPPDTEGLPDLPEGWAWTSLDQLLFELRNGYFGGRPAAEPPGVPILRISAVRPMSVSLSDPRYLPSVDDATLATYELQEGDLLFTRYNGNPNLVGACGLVRTVRRRLLYPDKLIRVRVPLNLVSASYVETFCSTDTARRFIERRSKTTAGQYGVAGGDLRQMSVALPPLSEQRRIVQEVERRMSVIEALETSAQTDLARAGRLRQAILKRAFEGHLVPQNPSDEPASVLLGRIRAQRKAQKAGKGAPKTQQVRLPSV